MPEILNRQRLHEADTAFTIENLRHLNNMAELQQNISKRFPEATFEDGEILLINIADSKLHDLV